MALVLFISKKKFNINVHCYFGTRFVDYFACMHKAFSSYINFLPLTFYLFSSSFLFIIHILYISYKKKPYIRCLDQKLICVLYKTGEHFILAMQLLASIQNAFLV